MAKTIVRLSPSIFLILLGGSMLTLSCIEAHDAVNEKSSPSIVERTNFDENFVKNLVERFDSLTAANERGGKISVSAEDLAEALEFGQKYVEKWNELEDHQSAKPSARVSAGNGHSYRRDRSFPTYRYHPESIAESKKAAVYLEARKYLSRKLNVPANELDLNVNLVESSERQTPTCDPTTIFRTIDGTCNNLAKPLYGKSGTIFQRISGANNNYNDGISTPRRSYYSKSPLPSARIVSSTVTVNDSIPDPDVSLLTMQMGQFLDHDLTLTPTFTFRGGSAVECCSDVNIGSNPSSPPHPECFPIVVPDDDMAYNPSGSGKITCMSLIRSTYGNNLDGTVPIMRQHINALTHWIDGSNIYGSTQAASLALRDTSSGKGKMKTWTLNGRQYLPLGPGCTPTSPCFDAGDKRVNEQPLLSVLHTLWVREHNRIADLVVQANPGKTEEFYFQHARRIVIASMQHIIYNEYLPVMIGPAAAAQVQSTEYDYREAANPAIFTEFSTAAFRMGHSQLRSFFRFFEADGRNSKNNYLLSNVFNDPSRLLDGNFIDNSLRGLLQTSSQSVDNCFADDITSQLFKQKGKSLGLDLISLNLQRGRDHGLSPYFAYWQFFSSSYALESYPKNFDDLLSRIPLEVVSSFKSIYESSFDIDLFIGGVTENPLRDAVLGPTFAGIFALQFVNLKRADRFFYTSNIGQPYALTANQLAEIKKASMARLLCDNSDGTLTQIQPKAFRREDDYLNKPVPCNTIQGMNINNFFAPVAAG